MTACRSHTEWLGGLASSPLAWTHPSVTKWSSPAGVSEFLSRFEVSGKLKLGEVQVFSPNFFGRSRRARRSMSAAKSFWRRIRRIRRSAVEWRYVGLIAVAFQFFQTENFVILIGTACEPGNEDSMDPLLFSRASG